MGEIVDFLRSASGELRDICRPLAELTEKSPGRGLMIAIGRLEDRIAPLHLEAVRYRCDAVAAGALAILTALDVIREIETDRQMGRHL